MSLLDMINFVLGHFVEALRLIGQETRVAMERAAENPPETLVSQNDFERFHPIFQYMARKCEELQLASACNRVERISMLIRLWPEQLTYHRLAQELTTLSEAIQDDIRYERFFHYARHRVQPLMRMRAEWAATLAPTTFPSQENEIERGLDCFGFEDYDGCVFHMMRVAEIGMRALARERKVSFPKHPLEWADWQNIIDGIEKSARAIGPAMPRGPAKDAALAFYSGAVAQLHAFKDTFRNMTMHVRKKYDELEALRAINQVRDFMNSLSAKIGEKTKKPIRRWP